ncbi:MAG: 2,3-bisphosphoglycerate-independent phosphoglycerate mutase [Candidatus Komeilibacteria bacterium]
MKNNKYKPVVLAILDGWGLTKPSKGNAIAIGNTPNIDNFWDNYPHTTLQASGKYVGLPRNQFGNSEAGHLNLGAGRIVKQDSVIINDAIKSGRFFKNPAFLDALKHVEKNKSSVHVMGLLSGQESAHAERGHLLKLLELIEQHHVSNIYLHLFTDGRDAPQHAALTFIREVQKGFKNGEKIVSIMGRYYAMDRNKTWSRTKKAYDLLTSGVGTVVSSPEEAILQAYNRNETDEYIRPTIIAKDNKSKVTIKDNDSVFFFNLRSDRARQLAKAFVQKDFAKMNPGSFHRQRIPKNLKFVAMTDFGPDLGEILVAFPSEDVKDTLPVALKDYTQLYISESEKFAHVTYFFNGGYADPVNGEARIKVPSPKVKSYAMRPEMSSKELTDIVVNSIKEKQYDFICINFPNPDMIGHTGNLLAGVKAVEAVDKAVGKIYKEIAKHKGSLVIVADHGNAEEMINLKTGEVHTEHTSNLVPFIIVNHNKYKLKKGSLCNVAPTILDMLDIKKPKLMAANSLITSKHV